MGIIAISWREDRAELAKAAFEAACREFERIKQVSVTAAFIGKQFAIAHAERTSLPGTGVHDDESECVAAACGWWYDPDAPSARTLADLSRSWRVDHNHPTTDRLEGQYVVVFGNKATGELVVSRDPMAAIPLYATERDGISWSCTSSLVLARATSAKLNTKALRAIFSSGVILAPHSAFVGIDRLHAGQQLRLVAGTMRETQEWSPFRAAMQHQNIAEAAERGLDLLRTSWNKMSETWERISCDLTAGLDSRLVVAVAAANESNFGTTVFGHEADTDVVIATEIAERFGWQLDAVDVPADWGARRWEYFRRGIELSDGEFAGSSLDKTLLVKELSLPNYDAATGGVGGEFYRDFFWQQELLNIGKTSKLNMERLLTHRFYLRPPRASLFREDWFNEFRNDIRHTAQHLIDQEPSALNTAKLDLLYLWKNSGGYARIGGAVANVMPSPFLLLGRRLYDFSAGVDWRFRTDGKLVREMIHQCHPGLASMRTWYGGSARPFSPLRIGDLAKFHSRRIKRVISKLGMMTIKHPIFPEPADRRMNPQHDADFIEILDSEGLLDVANLQTVGLYSKPGLVSLMQECRQPGFTDHRSLYAVVSIEHLCRYAGATYDESF